MSILIVEDNSISAKVLEFNLQKNAYQTIVAQSAKEALEHLTSTPQIQLIIADIMMPEMDGLELLNKIKEQPEWKDIPVIMCSSLADVETVKKAVQAGCRHYLIKPVKKEQLLAKVREALEYEKPILDEKREVISQFGLDEETYQELSHIFSAMLDDRIAWLEKRIEGETEPVKSLDLLDLLENAVYFGAGRLRSLLEEFTAKTEKADEATIDSEYRLLLRELKVLKGALISSTPNETQSMK
jgi:adenylate cyclase